MSLFGKAGRPMRSGGAGRPTQSGAVAHKGGARRPHSKKVLGGLDDVGAIGASLSVEIPAGIEKAGTALTSIANAIQGKTTPPTGMPTPQHDSGIPTWVVPTAIAAVAVVGGIALFKGMKKKKRK